MTYKLKYTGEQVDKSVGGFNAEILWDDINFDVFRLSTGPSAPSDIVLFGSGNIRGRSFGANQINQVWGGDEIIHRYVEGTDLKFHVHWMPTTDAAGVVVWNLEYTWYNAETQTVVVPAPQIISISQEAGGVAWVPKVVEFPAIDGAGMKIGSHFKFRFFRDPGNVQDTYPDGAAIDSLGVHYQVNSDGSRQIYTK